MRLSTPKHHDQYLQSIASQMGASVPEALNFLIWKLRESNLQFGAQLQPQQLPQQSPPQAPQIEFDSPRQAFIPQSPAAIREYEELAEAIDPVISRFLALGLADQF